MFNIEHGKIGNIFVFFGLTFASFYILCLEQFLLFYSIFA